MITASYYGHKEIVEYLISKGADLNIKDYSGKRAIDWAIQYNKTEIKNILENAEKNKSIPNSKFNKNNF